MQLRPVWRANQAHETQLEVKPSNWAVLIDYESRFRYRIAYVLFSETREWHASDNNSLEPQTKITPAREELGAWWLFFVVFAGDVFMCF